MNTTANLLTAFVVAIAMTVVFFLALPLLALMFGDESSRGSQEDVEPGGFEGYGQYRLQDLQDFDHPQMRAVIEQDVDAFRRELTGEGESWSRELEPEISRYFHRPVTILRRVFGEAHLKTGTVDEYDPQRAAEMLEFMYQAVLVHGRDSQVYEQEILDSQYLIEDMESLDVDMGPVREVIRRIKSS